MKYKLLLILILLIGFGLRIWQISKVPPSLSNDEISIAYEAYSIGNVGKDSTGAPFPLSFKSHETYKAPLYIYLTVPFVNILGNNELAVRLPSVIFGTLAILFLYLLVGKVTNNKSLAVVSSFLLAIAPWHVYTSRIALEANLALSFLILGAYLFYWGLEKRIYLVISSISLALSLYAYHTEWVFVPLLMAFLCISNWRRLKNKKDFALWIIVFIILVVPLGINWLTISKETNRLSTEVIFNDLFLRNRLAGVGNPITKIFIFLSFWADRFLKYLGLDFIFTNGLPVSASYSAPEFGLMTITTLPLFILGIIQVIKTDIRVRNFWLSWVILGALVVSLTQGELNLTRYLVSIVPIVVIIAYGVTLIRQRFGRVVTWFSLALVLLNFFFFFRYYIKLFPFHFSENWQYGYKQAAEYIKDNESKYKKVIIDPAFGVENNKYIGVPHLYLLYFNKMDPKLFLNTKKGGKENLEFMNKYYIRKVDWTKEEIEGKSLYLVSVHSTPLPRQKEMVREIYSLYILDGTKAFKFYESY